MCSRTSALPTCIDSSCNGTYIVFLSCEISCTVFELPLVNNGIGITHTQVVILSFPVSSIIGSIQMLEKGSKMLKVICTSTGGRPLTMSITGPSGYVENMTKIVNISDIKGVGKDNFSAEANWTKGTHGDTYVCFASNGVSNASDVVSLKGMSVSLVIIMNDTV